MSKNEQGSKEKTSKVSSTPPTVNNSSNERPNVPLRRSRRLVDRNISAAPQSRSRSRSSLRTQVPSGSASNQPSADAPVAPRSRFSKSRRANKYRNRFLSIPPPFPAQNSIPLGQGSFSFSARPNMFQGPSSFPGNSFQNPFGNLFELLGLQGLFGGPSAPRGIFGLQSSPFNPPSTSSSPFNSAPGTSSSPSPFGNSPNVFGSSSNAFGPRGPFGSHGSFNFGNGPK